MRLHLVSIEKAFLCFRRDSMIKFYPAQVGAPFCGTPAVAIYANLAKPAGDSLGSKNDVSQIKRERLREVAKECVLQADKFMLVNHVPKTL